MRIRRVIITNESSLSNVKALRQHSNIRKCWQLGCYILFEFYHPVYECIYDSDPAVSNVAWQNPSIKSEAAEAVAQERNLLEPLYRDVDNPSKAVLFLVPSRTTMYYFMGRGKGRIRWPFLGRSNDWETSNIIRVTGNLSVANAETIGKLCIVFNDWVASMKSLGEVIHADELAFSDSRFTVGCKFANACGDATMLLLMLLTESRYLTSLETVGFFLPGDVSSPFLEIGDSGKKYQ